MKQVLLSLLLLGCLKGFSQQNTSPIFEETYVDSTKIKIDSILLIGAGSLTTNIFIDDVSEYAIKSLSEKKIVARYYFLGETIKDAKSALDTIKKEGYKAILFFIPKGDTYFEPQGHINATDVNTRLGSFKIITPSSSLDYHQRFLFQLCLPDANKTNIWSASVEVSCNLKKSKTAKKVATNTISYFKNNGYIN